MPRARIGLWLTLAAALSGCGLITAPGEGDRLDAARRLWSSEGQRDYLYEVRSDCFCGLAGRWIEVTVIGGQVAGGTYLDTHTPVAQGVVQALPTVPDLFDRIRHAIEARAVLLEVQYDTRDGHPVRINVDLSHMVVDEEYLLQSRNLMGLLTASDGNPGR